MRNTIPYPIPGNSEQSLIFPIDIVTNPAAFISSALFYEHFLTQTGLYRLTIELEQYQTQAVVIRAFENIKQTFFLYIQQLYRQLKVAEKETISIHLNQVIVDGKSFDQVINEEINRLRIRHDLSFEENASLPGVNAKAGTIFRENLPFLLVLRSLFDTIASSTNSEEIYSFYYSQDSSLYTNFNHVTSNQDTLVQTLPTSTTARINMVDNIQPSTSKGTSVGLELRQSIKTFSDAATQTPQRNRKRKNENTLAPTRSKKSAK